ncbi:ATPase inhibitor [Zea mays]|uniref:ATPase inhibitor n=1 Tax=Zea mays TaxID=4577 RepID=A0A1D6H9Y8_MAIZE|nr:ATPase inhibitor [Zea mays]
MQIDAVVLGTTLHGEERLLSFATLLVVSCVIPSLSRL